MQYLSRDQYDPAGSPSYEFVGDQRGRDIFNAEWDLRERGLINYVTTPRVEQRGKDILRHLVGHRPEREVRSFIERTVPTPNDAELRYLRRVYDGFFPSALAIPYLQLRFGPLADLPLAALLRSHPDILSLDHLTTTHLSVFLGLELLDQAQEQGLITASARRGLISKME